MIREARLVPVGAPAPTDDAVDIRIADGRITEVAPELRPQAGEEVVDAAGRWAIPGLWDQHVHMRQWAETRNRLDVSGTADPSEVTRVVSAHLADSPPRPPGAVVVGFGYRSATWPRPPTVAELDAVSGDRAVALVSGDAHNGWLNSRALESLGLPARLGVLDEREWFPVFSRLSDLTTSRESTDVGYRAAVEAAAALGVVGIVDFEFGPGYREWPGRVADGIDQLRVRPAAYPEGLEEVIASGLRSGQSLPGSGGLVTMGPLKIIGDGSLNTRTAFCCEPFADAHDLELPRGKQNFGDAELVRLLRWADATGLEVAVHAIGDAAAASSLYAFAATGARGSIEHVQLIRWEDIPRMSRVGVRASVQPAHLYDDRDVTERCWPDRSDRCFLLRSLLDAGVTLAMGSDAPVARLDPWLAMAAAVHRSGDEREPWHPAQSLTAAEALAASTDGQRTLASGNRGDVVLLDEDPLRPFADSAATSAHLKGMPVAATFVGGRPTHREH